jgi:hypothetical protein
MVSLFALAAHGCKPADEGRASMLDEPRILAVRATPAESEPNGAVSIEILRAGPTGRLSASEVTLDLCIARKPIAAPGIVAEACLESGPSDSLVPIAGADPIQATLSEHACALFGPKPASASNDEALRPVDPDTTGGYYQPLRASDDGEISIVPLRISCGLTGTTQEVSIEYNRRYLPNENPAITRALMRRGEHPVETLDSAVSVTVNPSESITFAVTWPQCPSDENICGDGVCGLEEGPANCSTDCSAQASCQGAETYLLLDPVTGQLRLARENIRVSWYVTGGHLALDRSGRDSGDLARDAQNHWTAPAEPGDYWLFAVIRDDRGGTGWVIQAIRVDG